jgi:hypothetical protein
MPMRVFPILSVLRKHFERLSNSPTMGDMNLQLLLEELLEVPGNPIFKDQVRQLLTALESEQIPF